jgi:glycosyltransferase involved in cell wall biosynthesis
VRLNEDGDQAVAERVGIALEPESDYERRADGSRGLKAMKIAMLSPIAWRTPPVGYGPWERVVSLLTEGAVARGIDVTLFATADSVTRAKLHAIVPGAYEEDKALDPKVWECLHIAEVFERAGDFDLIHNHFDFLPLTYSGLTNTPVLTTIHGFSSPKILPVYRKYNRKTYYVSISNADRSPELDYTATVYHGIDLENFTFQETPGDYLLFFGRIHHDKGAAEALQIARQTGMKLILAGVIQDMDYFRSAVEPHLDGVRARYVGIAGPEIRNKLLGGARALLHPVNFNEPFGLSVVEAGACGTPVVAFNRGSMPEIIENGVNGFLVSDVRAATEAVRSLDAISRRQCRKMVEERFSRERMVEEYLGVYHKIIAKKSTNTGGCGNEPR